MPAPPPFDRDGGRDRSIVAAYVALIASAEACVAFVSPVVGAAAYAVLLTVMLTDAVLRQVPVDEARPTAPRVPLVDALLALSFLPVLRLVTMSAPVGAGTEAGRYLLVGAIILTAIAWAAWGVRLPGACLRPRVPTDRASDFVEFGVAWLAVPVAVGAYFATRPSQLQGDGARELATAALAVILIAIVEEVIFRGFVQTSLVGVYGASAGPVLATAVYVIFYLGVRPVEMVAYAAILGIMLGWVVQRSGSLSAPIVAHSLANVVLFVLLPQLVSSPTT